MTTSFSELVGKTLTRIEGLHLNSENAIFFCDDGSSYKMYHYHDCCEQVDIEDIEGDVEDLIGSPIILAEESTSDSNPPEVETPEYQDHFLWTFYRLATARGFVTLRWYGNSTGYYSLSVDFERIAP